MEEIKSAIYKKYKSTPPPPRLNDEAQNHYHNVEGWILMDVCWQQHARREGVQQQEIGPRSEEKKGERCKLGFQKGGKILEHTSLLVNAFTWLEPSKHSTLY